MAKDNHRFQQTLNDAFTQLSKGNFETAAAAFEKILEADSRQVEALHGLALTAFQGQDFDAATSLTARALAIDPLNASFHVTLGTAYQRLGDNDQAVICLKAALALAPENDVLRADFVLLLKSLGQLDEAQKWAGPVTKSDQENELYEKAISLTEQNDKAAAIDILCALIEARADFVLARNELAGIYQQAGRIDEFIEQMMAIVIILPTYTQAWTILGDNQRNLYRLKLICREVQLKLGLVLDGRNDTSLLKNARTAYEQALKNKPDHIGATLGLAELAVEEGDPATAIELFQLALNVRPSLVEAKCELAKLFRLSGRFEEAQSLFTEVEVGEPIARSSLIEIATCEFSVGDPDRAADWFYRALVVDNEAGQRPMDSAP